MERAHVLEPIPLQCSQREKEEEKEEKKKLAVLQGEAEKDWCLQ